MSSPIPDFVLAMDGVRPYSDELGALRRAHPRWCDAHLGAGPTFAIPTRAVGVLPLQRLFGQETMAAERAFAATCAMQFAVGVEGSTFICYPLLTPRPPAITTNQMREFGWTPAQVCAAAVKIESADAATARMLGVAGRLVTEPIYLRELAQLQANYEALPLAERPAFPLGRAVGLPALPPGSVAVPAAVGDFGAACGAFLDRWGLISLAHWHLPLPQGPLLPSPLPAGAPAEPRGVRIILPLHYPLQGTDDLLRQVADIQRRDAIQAGLPAGMFPVQHAEQHAQMFRLIHLELAVRSRFTGPAPRGFATALNSCAADELGIDLSSARRLRLWVNQCRDGRRATIKRLKD